MDALGDAHKILSEASQPLHFDVLVERLRQLGYQMERPEQTTLYNQIYNDIRKNGEHAKFKRTGRAMFCAAQIFDPQKHELAKPNTSPSNPNRELREYYIGPRVCGTCRHMEFEGPAELSMSYGTCSLWEQSERLTNNSQAPGCSLWQRRSVAQRREAAARQFELHTLVGVINNIVQSGKSYGPLDEFLEKNKEKARKEMLKRNKR